MTNFLARQAAAYRNDRTILCRTLRICAWVCWAIGAFYFAVPYFYAFGGTRIGAMAILSYSFVGAIFGAIGFTLSVLSRYAIKESHGSLSKAVLWCIAGAACFGIYVLAMLAIWSVIEHLFLKK